MAFSFWKNSPPRIKRILTIIIFFLLSIIIAIVGVLTPLSIEEADSMSKEVEQLRQNISLQFIFGNNFMICLLMFVPIAGPIFGFYALYNTGVLIAADSIAHGFSPLTSFLLLFVLPVVWLEFLAYSTAFAESVWLIWRTVHHKVRRELVNACILISICAMMLLVAAITEVVLITMLT